MASSLDLSLPEAPKPRRQGGWTQWLTLLIACATLALVAWQGSSSQGPVAAEAGDEVAEHFKQVATKLERRTLYLQAEKAWADYMEVAELGKEEEADLLYRRAKCLKEGGRYADAARRLSELETLPISRERKRVVGRMLLECLSALGKNEVREDLARAYAVVGEEERGTVVARVGGEDLTREELRSELAAQAQELIRHQGVPLTPTEREIKAQEFASQQLASTDATRQALMQIISSRLLYREALERGFGSDDALAKAIERFRRGYIAGRVVETEQEKALASLGPTDLRNHYEANKERFVEKASTTFSYAYFPTRDEAEDVLAQLRSGKDVPLQPGEGPAVSAGPLPGVGFAPELTAHVLALEEGEVSKNPLAHAGVFYVFRAKEKKPQRGLSFSEAEGDVRADLASIKTQEALEALRQLLSQKFRVELLDENLAPQPEAEGETTTDPESVNQDE